MSLKDLNLKSVYRTEDDNLLEDFYLPALKDSVSYDRAVGFFSAGMLTYAARGLSAFLRNNGYIRLIFGGELSEEDFRAIQSGYTERESGLSRSSTLFAETFLSEVECVSDHLFQRRLELLAFLVANGQLEIKVALRRRGMYHEKIGIFTDADGNKVVFQGSANETVYALLPDFNFESINVFQCWRPELVDHSQPHIKAFEKLWNDQQKNTFVVDFPRAAKEHLIEISKKCRTPISPKIEINLENQVSDSGGEELFGPRIPEFLGGGEFAAKPHQREALNAWKANDYSGILALATGAGKTITAIYGAVRILESSKRLMVVIAVPYQSLADQWVEVLTEFNIFAIRCYASTSNWLEPLTTKISLFSDGSLNFVCAVVVNRTLQSETFQSLVRNIPSAHFLFIGDECHHHASESLAKSLPVNAKLRLGLSATPHNIWNTNANARLESYYGPVVAEYSLAQALKDGVLTPYKYCPIVVDLTEDEVVEYTEISHKIARAYAIGQNMDLDNDAPLQLLLMARARLIGRAANKLTRLQEIIDNNPAQPLTLFYCGDGSVEDEDCGESIRQVDAVSKLLFRLGWRTAHFTASESRLERLQILDSFRTGVIDAMVAIKCLDEGIDVPACRTAYILASSRNPKQFIQRRGRILRRSPGKDFAEIFDFIVNIPQGATGDSDLEKRLLAAEFERIAEFASLATNSLETFKTLKPVMTAHGQQHLLSNLFG